MGGRLARLTHSAPGLPIPEWCVVLPEAFWASLPDERRDELVRARSDEEVVAVVARVKPAPEVTTELVEAFARLCRTAGSTPCDPRLPTKTARSIRLRDSSKPSS